MGRALTGAVAAAIALAACAGQQHPNPQALADQATQGIYDADYDRTTQNFDAALKLQVTRASIGALSDKMHALGAYHGLQPANSDVNAGRYDYQAAFDKGAMLVQIRVDPNWKIGAYRVSPETR